MTRELPRIAGTGHQRRATATMLPSRRRMPRRLLRAWARHFRTARQHPRRNRLSANHGCATGRSALGHASAANRRFGDAVARLGVRIIPGCFRTPSQRTSPVTRCPDCPQAPALSGGSRESSTRRSRSRAPCLVGVVIGRRDCVRCVCASSQQPSPCRYGSMGCPSRLVVWRRCEREPRPMLAPPARSTARGRQSSCTGVQPRDHSVPARAASCGLQARSTGGAAKRAVGEAEPGHEAPGPPNRMSSPWVARSTTVDDIG
jgi:hypothetical protein